jgi:hypothetical protein
MKTVPFYRSVLAVILVTFLAVGCAKQSGNNAAYQDGSDNCSDEFVSDYNSVILSFQYAYSVKDLADSSTLVDAFQEKYEGVVCKAQFRTADQLDPTEETVDADEIVAAWKSALDSVMTQANTPSDFSSARQSLAAIRVSPANTEAN